MTIDTDTRARDGTGIAAQWVAMLLPPVAFLVELEIAYLLVPLACRTGNPVPVHLAHAGALLLASGGIFLAWREWRRWGSKWPEDAAGPEPRSRFMTTVALMGGAGFALIILALWLPTFFLNPCQ